MVEVFLDVVAAIEAAGVAAGVGMLEVLLAVVAVLLATGVGLLVSLRRQAHRLGQPQAALVEGLEGVGIRVLVNETVTLDRAGDRLHLTGLDDVHYFHTPAALQALRDAPDGCKVALVHSAEVADHASDAGFSLYLAGHTHGGQICLPGQIPLTLDAKLPRYMGSGPWQYRDLIGYTSVGVGSSVVTVRFNCLPEITLHHLKCA